MAFIYGEIGKDIYVDANYDVNAAPFTELTLTFTLGDQTVTRDTSDGVTAPAVDSPALPANPDNNFPGGVLEANTYVVYRTQASDWGPTAFDQPGEWKTCLTYEDATPRTLLTQIPSSITFEEPC